MAIFQTNIKGYESPEMEEEELILMEVGKEYPECLIGSGGEGGTVNEGEKASERKLIEV